MLAARRHDNTFVRYLSSPGRRCFFRKRLFLPCFAAVALFLLPASEVQAEKKTTSRPCPYDCRSLGLSSKNCSDYRIGGTCYVVREVQDKKESKAVASRICLQAASGRLRIRARCLAEEGESEAFLSDLGGEKGEKGEKGEPGEQGAPGADGSLRIYGDGSAGDVVVNVSEVYEGSSDQYRHFTISQGATLTVPSGSVIRCSGNFENNGNIVVLPAQRQHPKVSENGRQSSSTGNAGTEALGGDGGSAVSEGLSRAVIRPGLLGGGDGYKTDTEDGSSGGGSILILCKNSVLNAQSGTISADGEDGAELSRGGGGGGIIILAAGASASNQGIIRARGGSGSDLLANNGSNTGYGPGGGGGGGIVHIIAPSASSPGTVDVSGGSGGAAGGAGSITAIFYSGGGGGGASGGDGGDGGTVNPGNIGDDSATAGQSGTSGKFFLSLADPESLY